MENVIDIRTALEQLGTGWQFGGSVTDGTQEAWDAVTWEDERTKPTWEDLLAVVTVLSTSEQINLVEKAYAEKLAALDAALLNALWVGGVNETATRQALSAKREQFLLDKEEAILNTLLVT